MTIRGIQENLNKRDTILKKKINSPIYSSRNGPCLPYDYRFDCIHNGETRNRLSLIRFDSALLLLSRYFSSLQYCGLDQNFDLLLRKFRCLIPFRSHRRFRCFNFC